MIFLFMTPNLWTTTSLPLKRSTPHLISPYCIGIALKKEKNNLGTSSIFHEFSFRPEPPLTLVDRSSCCHIFNTWGYSCYLWGLPLTQARSETAWVSARTPYALSVTYIWRSSAWNWISTYSSYHKCVSQHSHWKPPHHHLSQVTFLLCEKIVLFFSIHFKNNWRHFTKDRLFQTYLYARLFKTLPSKFWVLLLRCF